MNAKTAIDEKRTALLGNIAKARIDGDAEAVQDYLQKVREWNARNPEYKITGQNIRRSISERQRRRALTKDGVFLPASRENLRDLGRFANAE
jgi:hypothetical protein